MYRDVRVHVSRNAAAPDCLSPALFLNPLYDSESTHKVEALLENFTAYSAVDQGLVLYVTLSHLDRNVDQAARAANILAVMPVQAAPSGGTGGLVGQSQLMRYQGNDASFCEVSGNPFQGALRFGLVASGQPMSWAATLKFRIYPA